MPFSVFLRSHGTFIFFLSLSLLSFGQFQHSSFSIEKMLAGKSAYIIDENLEINIYGKDSERDDYRAFNVSRNFTVKVLSSNGLKIFQEMTLPEDFDPTYRPHASPVKNIGIYYSGYKVESYRVMVKRNGKKPFSPKVKKKINFIESFNLDYIYEYSQISYTIEGIEIGDEVTISYELIIPFEENYSRFASYRIFHHDTLPKLKYKFTLTHHELLDIELYQNNNAVAKRQVVEKKIVKRIWEYENLPGCIKETGSRPYTELPHITWVINHYKYYVHNSNIPRNVPHYAIIASLKSKDLPDILVAIDVGSKSKQYAPFNKTYEKIAKDFPDNYTAIKAIHTEITENFIYKKDKEYYLQNDLRGKRFGEFFENGILRDVNRYETYFAIFVKARAQFYSAHIIDKRFGEVSDEYFHSNFDSDFLLTIYFGERIIDILLPKRNNFGWYYNEIPFYWEDCKARLVNITDYAHYRNPIKETFRSLQTHLTSFNDNIREHKIKVMVDMNEDSTQFSGSVFLQGQYSTMCRFSYLKGYKDPTVNTKYNKTLWQFISSNDKGEVVGQSISSNFPFQSKFDMLFNSTDIITKDNNGYVIDLKNWFPHISPKVNSEQNRFLTYYPDFLGEDRFEYELQFKDAVELETPVTFGFENEFGYYKFSVYQESPVKIVISSEFHVNNSSISSEDYDVVQDIFKAISLANKYKLKVK